jgi:hypothetical protein
MSQKLKMVFEKLFPECKVVNAKVIPRLDELFTKAVKLRKYRKLHRFYKHKNNESKPDGSKPERRLIKKWRGLCCCKKVEVYDAEKHYREKIINLSKEIRIEREKKLKYNGGFGFVTFISNL